MKKYLFIFGVAVVFIGLLFGLGVSVRSSYMKQPSSADALPYSELKQEEIAGLIKPAVVRIVQEVSGEATVPTFSIDFKSLSIVPRPEQEAIRMPINEKISGSGFIVSQDGYILTNAHVVSYQTAKLLVAESVLERVLTEGIYDAIANNTEIPTDNVEEKGKKLGEQVMEYILSKGQFALNKKVTVLNPSSQRKDDISSLVADGFPAKIVSVSDTFEKDNKDVALIKISEINLPSVKLAVANELSPGQKVYVFGFPGSAEFNANNLVESTFTQGTIGAIKNSKNGDFNLYQTDAKVSQGSSGGPMVNSQGEVIGLITYQSSEMQRSAGDNFAFAIPVGIVEKAISDSIVSPDLFPGKLNDTMYRDVFLEGIRLENSMRAKQALVKFQQAQTINPKFSVKGFVDPLITKSQSLIDSKQSVDTAWDEKMLAFRNVSGMTWVIVIGAVTAIVIGVVIVTILVGRVRKDEEEIEYLESYLENERGAHMDAFSSQQVSQGMPQGNSEEKTFRYPKNLGNRFSQEKGELLTIQEEEEK